jgi:hypothetical protein
MVETMILSLGTYIVPFAVRYFYEKEKGHSERQVSDEKLLSKSDSAMRETEGFFLVIELCHRSCSD